MRILQVSIRGFRGIRSGKIDLRENAVIVGPNNCGKTTLLDAIALVLGREKIVRRLTEHDFWGSSPSPTDRFHLVVTVGEFEGNDPGAHVDWFRAGRAVPKWYAPKNGAIEPEPSESATMLCAQIAICGRFDYDTLSVETLRYFFDGDMDDLADPFVDESPCRVPGQLLGEIGFFVAPAVRTWDRVLSFGSEIFRHLLSDLGGLPSDDLLALRDSLRNPEHAPDSAGQLAELAARVNASLRSLFPTSPEFKLRLTQTDSESLLQSLIPHYATGDCLIPVSRQGTGLLALQTLLLLMEFGQVRTQNDKGFVLGIEEPELHVSPGMQGRIIRRSTGVATQTVVTTHSPRVASFFKPTNVIVVENVSGELAARALLAEKLAADAPNCLRKLFLDNVEKTVDALMQPAILVPEGRIDFEWLTRLSGLLDKVDATTGAELPDDYVPFGSVVGVVPTHASAVVATWNALSHVRSGVTLLIDGDDGGDAHVTHLLAATPPPKTILQWADDWEIEDVVAWLLQANEVETLAALNSSLGRAFASFDEFVAYLKTDAKNDGAKDDFLAHEEIASVIFQTSTCVHRTRQVLHSLGRTLQNKVPAAEWQPDVRSTEKTRVLRWIPE